MLGDQQSGTDLHAIVVSGGDHRHAKRQLRLLAEAGLVLAADGGANWLYDMGLIPRLLVGDLDSVRDDVRRELEQRGCRMVVHPTAKDETDTELALLEAVACGARRITLLGGTGSRIDHTLANVMLLTLPELEGIETRLFDGHSFLILVRDTATIRGDVEDTVSLIPLRGDARGVRTEGLAYPLRDETLRFGPARGISNVMTAPEARVSLREGLLLLVHTPRVNLEEQ